MCFSLKSSARWALALLALLSLPACSQKREPREKPLVVTSFFPLYDFARQLSGTNFDVRCLVPPGADPHSVEASAGSAKLIADSDLVLLLGLGIDGWVERLAKAEGRRQMATISGGIPTRKPTPMALEEFGKTAGAGPKHDHDHDHDHDHAHPAGVDPHLWMDPLIAQQLVKRIGSELITLAPQHKAVVEERQARLVADIQKLHEDFGAAAAKFQKREVVTFHGAFSYLLARYDVKEAAIIQMFPGDEPSAAYLRKLVDLVRGKGITVVFAETSVPDRAAQVIAKEIGGSVEKLDPLERQLAEAPDSGYLERQRANLETFKRVLGQKE